MHTVLAQGCSYRKPDYKIYSQDNVYMGEMRVDWDKLNRDYSREIRDTLNEFELTVAKISSRIDNKLNLINKRLVTDNLQLKKCPLCESELLGQINLPLSKVSLVCDDCGYMSGTVPMDQLKSLKTDWNILSEAITDSARKNTTWYDTIQCVNCPHREPQTDEERETCWECVTKGLAPEDATLRRKVLEVLELHNHIHFQ